MNFLIETPQNALGDMTEQYFWEKTLLSTLGRRKKIHKSNSLDLVLIRKLYLNA